MIVDIFAVEIAILIREVIDYQVRLTKAHETVLRTVRPPEVLAKTLNPAPRQISHFIYEERLNVGVCALNIPYPILVSQSGACQRIVGVDSRRAGLCD